MIKVKELTVDEYLSGTSVHLLDVSGIFNEDAYRLMLKTIETLPLAKLYRNLVISESYESIKPVEAELKLRGYEITLNKDSIKFELT
jgi:hypothetical protein